MKDFSTVEVHEGGCKDGVWLIGGSVTSANILGFEAGTTGYRGGDAGHGGRTFFSLFDLGSSEIRATTDGGVLSVELGGDCELDTIIVALRAIALILEASVPAGTECTGAEQIKALMEGESEKTFEKRKVDALENIATALRLMALAEYSDPATFEQIHGTWGGPGGLPNRLELKRFLWALNARPAPTRT